MYCVKFLDRLRGKFGFFTEDTEGNEGFPRRVVVSFFIFGLGCLPVHRLYEKADRLSREVIGAAIEVQRHKGPGLIESIYQRCLLRELELGRFRQRRKNWFVWNTKGSSSMSRCVFTSS